MLWSNSVPTFKKIREIQEGVEEELIESINDSVVLQDKASELFRSARSEILIIFSSANLFEKQKRICTIAVIK